MNEADSLTLEQQLASMGFGLVDTVEAADVVILNTCSVRRKAEERIFGQLGHLKSEKANRSKKFVIGVIGCMAEGAKDELIERTPYVDFLCSPDEVNLVPEKLLNIFALSGDSDEVNHQRSLPGDNDQVNCQTNLPVCCATFRYDANSYYFMQLQILGKNCSK